VCPRLPVSTLAPGDKSKKPHLISIIRWFNVHQLTICPAAVLWSNRIRQVWDTRGGNGFSGAARRRNHSGLCPKPRRLRGVGGSSSPPGLVLELYLHYFSKSFQIERLENGPSFRKTKKHYSHRGNDNSSKVYVVKINTKCLAFEKTFGAGAGPHSWLRPSTTHDGGSLTAVGLIITD